MMEMKIIITHWKTVLFGKQDFLIIIFKKKMSLSFNLYSRNELYCFKKSLHCEKLHTKKKEGRKEMEQNCSSAGEIHHCPSWTTRKLKWDYCQL